MRKVSAARVGAVAATRHSVTRILNRDIVLTSPFMREIAEHCPLAKGTGKLGSIRMAFETRDGNVSEDSSIDASRIGPILDAAEIRERF